MTKVQMQFRLRQPLDESLLQAISDVHAIYGIQRVRVAPSLDQLFVEYDASRLRPAEVEAALAQAGIPLQATAA
jgi:hypothetical protein